MTVGVLEQLRSLSQGLTKHEKLQLIDDLVDQLLHESPPPEKKAFRSIRGIMSGLGPSPSKEVIDEMRREAWADFPREDI